MKIDIIKDEDAIILIGTQEDENAHLDQLLLNRTIYEDEIRQISNPKRLREFLMVRLLLQHFFSDNRIVVYNEEGKPRIPGSGFELSISHCSKKAAVILHPQRNVGIDIEKRGRNVQKVVRRFMSNDEQSDFADTDNSDALLLIWSAKEALYKIIGKDAFDFAASFRIYPFESSEWGIMKAEYLKTNKLYSLQYRCTESYVLVWVIE